MLGFITPTIAFVLLLIGVFGLIRKGALGGYANSILGAIPIGNAKLWSIIFVVVGLVMGGIAGGTAIFGGLTSGATVASLTNQDADTMPGVQLGSCTLSDISTNTGYNVTFRSDPNNNQREYADVKFDSGAAIINGTLSCERGDTSDLSKGGAVECFVESDSYRSETSTTDSNTYYIVATSTSASKVSGYPWAQTVYLNSGSVATTTSNQEKTNLVFAQDVAQQTLGFHFVLPGATPFSYLNNQTSNDINIVCGGDEIFNIVVTKTTA